MLQQPLHQEWPVHSAKHLEGGNLIALLLQLPPQLRVLLLLWHCRQRFASPSPALLQTGPLQIHLMAHGQVTSKYTEQDWSLIAIIEPHCLSVREGSWMSGHLRLLALI